MLFIQLVEVGSFSKLSNIIGISQPTLSRRIANLEYMLKAELIIRTTNNFRLSPAGTALYEKFKDHKYFLDNALSEIRETHGAKPHGILRVALPVLLSKNIIVPYIGPFLENTRTLI